MYGFDHTHPQILPFFDQKHLKQSKIVKNKHFLYLFFPKLSELNFKHDYGGKTQV